MRLAIEGDCTRVLLWRLLVEDIPDTVDAREVVGSRQHRTCSAITDTCHCHWRCRINPNRKHLWILIIAVVVRRKVEQLVLTLTQKTDQCRTTRNNYRIKCIDLVEHPRNAPGALGIQTIQKNSHRRAEPAVPIWILLHQCLGTWRRILNRH